MYTSWEQFDVAEYTKRNYGQVLAEDRAIIQRVATVLGGLGIGANAWRQTADVGTGPNLYPAMLFAPFVAEGGRMDLTELNANSRAYVQKVLDGQEHEPGLTDIWGHFEEVMTGCGEMWKGALDKVRARANVMAGDVFNLPPGTYDAVSAFFLSESITDSPDLLKRVTHNLFGILKPGGFFVGAHMLGSKHWFAGEGTNFPSVPVEAEDLQSLYAGVADVEIYVPPVPPAAREGYHGMAVVTGTKL